MIKSKSFLPTFDRTPPEVSPPSVGGDEGEGDPNVFIQSTPTLSLPHRRGRGIG